MCGTSVSGSFFGSSFQQFSPDDVRNPEFMSEGDESSEEAGRSTIKSRDHVGRADPGWIGPSQL